MRSSRLLALTALVWLLNAALACATSLALTGAGGAAVAYNPGLGIQITSYDAIQSTQLGNTDSAVGTSCMLIQGLHGATNYAAGSTNGAGWQAANRDYMSNVGSGATYTTETVPGINLFGSDDTGGFRGSLRLNWNDATGGNNHSIQAYVHSFYIPYNDTWHELCAFWDFTTSSRKAALTLDGVEQAITGPTDQGAVTSPFLPNVNNARGFMFGLNAGNGAPADYNMNQFLLDVHTTGLLDVSSHVSAAVLAKLWPGGGPGNWGTDGSALLGTKPEVYHLGDASTFLTENGSSAATWSMATQISGYTHETLRNPLWGVAGPPAGKPYNKWAGASGQLIATATITAGTAVTFTNRGQPIAQGDMMACAVEIEENGSNTDRHITKPASWSYPTGDLSGGSYHPGTSNLYYTLGVFYKIMGVGDVTASGAEWAGDTFTYTGGAGSRGAFWECMDLGNAATLSSKVQTNTSAATATAPSVTAAANNLLINLFAVDSGDLNNGFPANQTLLFSNVSGQGGGANLIMTGEYPAAGATGTRVLTFYGGNDLSIGASLLAGPP